MNRINQILVSLFAIGMLSGASVAEEIAPTWQSMAEHYNVPQWFQDGKIGVWFHWGISSAADENRPNDGSHYGRRMYSVVPEDYTGTMGMSETLTKWHTERYGHPSEFGYEDLIPLFKAENWDPDALVQFVKENGARFIMPVACHHDNFDMYDSFHPWNSVTTAVNRMSITIMVGNAVDAISKNGVVMLNVALKGDGTIPENQAAYLTAFGDFLKTCGEGIYGSRPWKIFGEGPLVVRDGRQGENRKEFSQKDIRFTTKDGVLYAFVLAPPTEDIVIKTLASGGVLENEIAGIGMMGSDEEIHWTQSTTGLTITLPTDLPDTLVVGFEIQLN